MSEEQAPPPATNAERPQEQLPHEQDAKKVSWMCPFHIGRSLNRMSTSVSVFWMKRKLAASHGAFHPGSGYDAINDDDEKAPLNGSQRNSHTATAEETSSVDSPNNGSLADQPPPARASSSSNAAARSSALPMAPPPPQSSALRFANSNNDDDDGATPTSNSQTKRSAYDAPLDSPRQRAKIIRAMSSHGDLSSRAEREFRETQSSMALRFEQLFSEEIREDVRALNCLACIGVSLLPGTPESQTDCIVRLHGPLLAMYGQMRVDVSTVKPTGSVDELEAARPLPPPRPLSSFPPSCFDHDAPCPPGQTPLPLDPVAAMDAVEERLAAVLTQTDGTSTSKWASLELPRNIVAVPAKATFALEIVGVDFHAADERMYRGKAVLNEGDMADSILRRVIANTTPPPAQQQQQKPRINNEKRPPSFEERLNDAAMDFTDDYSVKDLTRRVTVFVNHLLQWPSLRSVSFHCCKMHPDDLSPQSDVVHLPRSTVVLPVADAAPIHQTWVVRGLLSLSVDQCGWTDAHLGSLLRSLRRDGGSLTFPSEDDQFAAQVKAAQPGALSSHSHTTDETATSSLRVLETHPLMSVRRLTLKGSFSQSFIDPLLSDIHHSLDALQSMAMPTGDEVPTLLGSVQNQSKPVACDTFLFGLQELTISGGVAAAERVKGHPIRARLTHLNDEQLA